ncbi:MAG: hypothetical protein ACRDTR_05535 [Rubrobacter sp.]
MGSQIVERERLDLRDNPELLSPPVVVEPLYGCAAAVTVQSYAPGAEIEIRVDASIVATAPGGFPWPDGVTIQLPAPLVAGERVRARQRTTMAQSDWSAPVTVRDHTRDYPAGPPRPEINPAPVYRCGVRTGVSNLLTGGDVWITADGAEVGRVQGCSQHQGVNVSPAYGLGQKVRAWFELCNDPSPPSLEHTTQVPPSPLPQLTFDPTYEGGQQVTVRGVVNGARVTLSRGGTPVGTWPCWGYALTVGGLSPFASGEAFSATQSMCPGDPSSHPGEGTVQPCSALPAPQVGPVQAGDNRITLTGFVPDAIIRVYLNGVQVGASGGPVVLLSARVFRGDTLHVVQDLLGCTGQYALEITVACVDPPTGASPDSLNLFPVGWFEYAEDGIRGSVYYPARDDGVGQPFNDRLAALGRAPIVFMAHGNHTPADPSYLGYDYFQQHLARMGIIAVSVDCNALNGGGAGVQNIEARADLIIDNIAYFQGLDSDAGSVFFGRIDFGRVGLMGHSRGGEAVVTIPTVISLPGVTIRSGLALAPTNFRSWAGLSTIPPQGYAFMTILPAGDGDVRDNNGAQFYDRADPDPYKSQLYAHYTNHNFFNREWLDDDSLWTPPQPAVMARGDHERILSAYGCALYRATLLGHATTAYLVGNRLPAGVPSQHVHLSFTREEALTVDDHEDNNTIHQNSLGLPTAQLLGMSADEFVFARTPGAFNNSFYGESTGMVVEAGRPGRAFRTELREPVDLYRHAVWIRAAEVTDGSSVPSGATGFELGLEDTSGIRAWVDSDDVGGLPRPYARNPGMIKTMLKTLRFRGACFAAEQEFDIQRIQAILIRCGRRDERALAFDDLQIVERRG